MNLSYLCKRISCNRYLSSNPNGITLVELVVAMLILSVLAGVASSAFLLISRSDREIRNGLRIISEVESALKEIRRDTGNLIPGEVGGIAPYSESTDAKKGGVIYSFLSRLNEGHRDRDQNGLAQAVRVEIFTAINTDQSLRLLYSKQPIALGGPIEEKINGVLASHIADFSMSPNYNKEGSESTESGPQVPISFSVHFRFEIPGVGMRTLTQTLAVDSVPIKESE